MGVLNKKDVQSLFVNRFRRIKKHYLEMEKDMGVEAIHDFRVELKKLRALLRLYSLENGNKISLPGNIKRVYRKSGAVRELQLYSEKMETESIPDGTAIDRVKINLDSAIRELRYVMDPGLLKEAQGQIGKNLPATIRQKTIISYFKSKEEQVRTICMGPVFSDDALHTIRKILKDLLYTAQILQRESSFQFPAQTWDQEKEKGYSEFSAELGIFQDLCAALKQFILLNEGKDPDQLKYFRAEKRHYKRQLIGRLKQRFLS